MIGNFFPRLYALISSATALVIAAAVLVSAPVGATELTPSNRASAVVADTAEPSVPTELASGGIQKAANLSLFRPGNIISDAVFFNSASMNAVQIDAFFRGKVSSCQSGYVCLKDYRQNTPNRPADSYCDGYSGAAGESAATIIYRVAQSCGINPQVLIVMLQKEQGLVTHTWPSSWRYDMALGQGCPDTAPCDPAYSGFFYQIYGAARQMQIYAEGRWFTYYAPGKTWNILYHPNRGCGTSPVYVENTATAALYYYTPYQPNQAALNAGYGEGDSCSSYGNRNFYQYFSDWFGTPSYAVTGGLADYWNARGAGAGHLGEPTGHMSVWAGAGWSQPFVNADLLQKLGGPVLAVGGAFRVEYRVVGHFWSGLGWPTSEQVPVSGGYYQDFQGGRIYVRPDGRGFAIAAPMFDAHEALQNVAGPLGWPTGRAYRTADGSRQDFDTGSIFSNASGTVALPSDLVTTYDGLGGYAMMGSPLTADTPDASGGHVAFSSGWIQRTSSGILAVKGALGAGYTALGGGTGELGAPTGAERRLASGGWSQQFAKGTLYHSRTGTFAVTGLQKSLAALGGVDALGYPSAAQVTSDTRISQTFGAITLVQRNTTSAPQIVKGSIGALYTSIGGVASLLGAATGPERYANGGWSQTFEGGTILSGPYGTFSLPTTVATVHDGGGGVTGRLGWPTGPATASADGGWNQTFAGGSVYASGTVGGAGGGIFGSILNVYRAGGGPSIVGYPTGREKLVTNAWKQDFERGVVFVPSHYPASIVSGKTFTLYSQIGAEARVGLPTGTSRNIAGGSLQNFEVVSIYESSSGAWQNNGVIRDVYLAFGGPAGSLGWPTESMLTVPGGWRQIFTGSGIFVSSYGTFAAKGALGAEYIRRGAQAGELGWPTAAEAISGGLWTQRFQNGTLVLNADGTFEVR